MSVVFFDLDGTLSLTDHRQHYVRGDNKDWDAFYDMCHLDPVHEPVARIAYSLWASGWTVYILSGRSDQVRDKTVAWLEDAGIQYDKLQMREQGDYTPDHELKERWFLRMQHQGINPTIVFDDRDKVVKMWRANGITCCQVAEGAF